MRMEVPIATGIILSVPGSGSLWISPRPPVASKLDLLSLPSGFAFFVDRQRAAIARAQAAQLSAQPAPT